MFVCDDVFCNLKYLTIKDILLLVYDDNSRASNIAISIGVWEGTSRDVPIFGLKGHSVSNVD